MMHDWNKNEICQGDPMERNIIKTIIVLGIFVFCLPVFAQENSKDLIQAAILLDTSNSMDGLINQTKAQLWKIVNELALARKNGRIPQLQIALYEYGNNSIPQKDGYIRQVVGLTGDLDRISDELFRLKTNGGDEYCGQVIDRAVRELQWSREKDVLKIIFIAGNEPFTQGSYDYKKSCRDAIGKGIIVNTIFCGNREEGIRSQWKDGADLADGLYSNIDQNQSIAHMAAPQDDEISRLGRVLNDTYVAYGAKGKEAKELQAKQDANAQSVAAPVLAERSVAKASAQYSNSGWDLVDASVNDPGLFDKVEKEQLPQEMRDMNSLERKNYIAEKAGKRKEIQAQINTLNSERQKYIAEQQKKTGDKTLDQAVLGAIRKQAQEKNYVFE
jgi:hypothetical protein